MIPAHLDDFWSSPRLATFGTVRRDGSPHLTPVKAMRCGEDFLVLTRPTTVKARNVRRTGRASIAEHTSSLWATVEGAAVVSEEPDDLARARAAYAERFGRPDTWGTCVMVLRPDRVLHGA
ncbi:pyridoxamine 5'-phosphate oxidase family protein [Nocardioides sp. GCM10027113]|uniref:pyridoxamine 5'-phosphate oxidase family protein n=1 Tax=unclassified Nocardioides TaxID=2615069 RepID=UPI003605E676